MKEMLMRIPPHMIGAEVAVLQAMFFRNDLIPKISQKIGKETWFYKDNFGVIYRAMLNLFREKKPIDIITIIDELQKEENLEVVGGESKLRSLFFETPPTMEKDGYSLDNWEHYLRIIQEKYLLRKLIIAANIIFRVAYEEDLKLLRKPISRMISVIEEIKQISKKD